MLWLRPVSLALVALVFVQVLLGALVAGTHAGFLYNTWPLIDGAFWPRGLLANAPWFVNFGENQLTVQFDHRLGAYAVTLLVAAIWLLARPRGEPATKRALDILGGLVLLQMALGIETLLHVVPLPLGLLHQAGALALFAGLSISRKSCVRRPSVRLAPWLFRNHISIVLGQKSALIPP